MFRIVQLSDLHCGTQFFLPQHLERAIAEVNEMEPDVVVISGDLTSNGFKDEYALAREYLNGIECKSMVVIPGNHDSRNVGYVHFEDLFGERNSVLSVGPATIVAVDSSEPDLDNGQVGRGRYRLIEEAFAGAANLRIFVLHHHLLPIPGNRPRAQHRPRRRRHARVASSAPRSTSSWPATSTSRTPGGSRISSSSTPGRSPRRGCAARAGPVTTSSRSRAPMSTCGGRYPFHGQEKIIQFSTETKTYEKYTAKIDDEVRST